MAVIAATNFKGTKGVQTITKTTLSADDTLVYISGRGQILILENPTGGSLTATIDGSGSTTISPDGLGTTVDVSAGLAVVIPAGGFKAINLDTISAYLAGTVHVTGAATAVAALLN